MIWIECSARFAAINRKILTGSRFPWQRRPPLFQDLALLGDRPQLATQPPQLLALIGGQARGLALVDADLARPVAQRLRRDTQLGGEQRDELSAALEQCNRLAAELHRIRGWHETPSSRRAPTGSALRCPRNRGNSTYGGGGVKGAG